MPLDGANDTVDKVSPKYPGRVYVFDKVYVEEDKVTKIEATVKKSIL